MMLKVNTIYPAFMGECNKFGIGARCVFIRLSGCNLRCYTKTFGTPCDTPEALSFSSGKEMSELEILQEVHKYNSKYICLTGGEPLCQDVTDLLRELGKEFFYTIVETNGSRAIKDYRYFRNVSFVVDYKSPSSGETDKMVLDNLNHLDRNDWVKFVLYDNVDYDDMRRVVERFCGRINVAVGLYWGSTLSYKELSENILRHQLKVTLNFQAHKMMVLYDKHREELKNLVIPRTI